MTASSPPAATSERPGWLELPEQVRATIEQRIGGVVVATANQTSGFTRCFASRLAIGPDADSPGEETAFVKASSDQDDPLVADCYRLEATVVAGLPGDNELPVPALRWAGDEHGWVVLCFDDIPGRPPHRPWQPAELTNVLTTLASMAETLAAAPSLPAVPDLADWRTQDFGYWQSLSTNSGDDRLADLAKLESTAGAALAGTTFLHGDLRDDNVIVGDDGRIWFCDWNWASRGPEWYDLVMLLITAHGDGYDANALLGAHPLGENADADAVDAVLAGLSGHWSRESARSPLPGAPVYRQVQAWYAEAALSWLALRRNWLD
ncbi:phosphotransferase family protein [Flindersiella endophytica]